MSIGKYHKTNCSCKLCKGEAGFQKNHKINIGRKCSDEKKDKLREKRKKYKISNNTKNKISKTLKIKHKNGIIKNKTLWVKGHKINLGKKHTEKTKRKIRISKQKYFERLGPREGKNEQKILNLIEKEINYKIIRQFPIIGYFVDGYIPSLNLVIEIDENHHFEESGKLKKEDIKRQKEIEDELSCKFLRIKDF